MRQESSIIHLDKIDVIVAGFAAIGAYFAYKHILWSVLPFNYTEVGDLPTWFVSYRQTVFDKYVWIFILIGVVSTISLLRAVRGRQDYIPIIGSIYPIGYLFMSWPLLYLVPTITIHTIMVFIMLPFWFISLGLGLIAMLYAIFKDEGNFGNTLVLVIGFSMMFFNFMYFSDFIELGMD